MCCRLQVAPSGESYTEVTAGLVESNGSLLPGLWRDSLHVTCGLTACTPGSAPGPTLGNEYGKTLLYLFYRHSNTSSCIAGQDQRSAVAIFLTCRSVRVCRPKLFKNLCLSLVSGVPPLLCRTTPLFTAGACSQGATTIKTSCL